MGLPFRLEARARTQGINFGEGMQMQASKLGERDHRDDCDLALCLRPSVGSLGAAGGAGLRRRNERRSRLAHYVTSQVKRRRAPSDL